MTLPPTGAIQDPAQATCFSPRHPLPAEAPNIGNALGPNKTSVPIEEDKDEQ